MNNTNRVGIEMDKKLPGFFEQLSGLVKLWYISKVEHKELEVHIHIDFKRGTKFLCEGELCRVRDTIIRQWQHMNLFRYKTYIHERHYDLIYLTNDLPLNTRKRFQTENVY